MKGKCNPFLYDFFISKSSCMKIDCISVLKNVNLREIISASRCDYILILIDGKVVEQFLLIDTTIKNALCHSLNADLHLCGIHWKKSYIWRFYKYMLIVFFVIVYINSHIIIIIHNLTSLYVSICYKSFIFHFPLQYL